MSNDTIKRSDAIAAITNHCKNKCYYREDKWCPQCQREEFQEAIKVVPSADRPKGEWIETSEGTMCGNCHKFPYDDGEYHIANWYSGFCPNCGAKMKGADDDSNNE